MRSSFYRFVFGEQVTNRTIVLLVIMTLCWWLVVFSSKAGAAEIITESESVSSFQLREGAFLPGMNLEDELTRDDIINELESVMEAQAQEDLIQDLMSLSNAGEMSSELFTIKNGHFGSIGPAR